MITFKKMPEVGGCYTRPAGRVYRITKVWANDRVLTVRPEGSMQTFDVPFQLEEPMTYEVTMQLSKTGCINDSVNIIRDAFGTSQGLGRLKNGEEVRFRVTSDQFLRFFLLRRERVSTNWIKWNDAKEVCGVSSVVDCTR